MSKKNNNKTEAPPVVQDCHDLLIWLIPLLDQFPRARRFSLGERLEPVGWAERSEAQQTKPRKRWIFSVHRSAV